MKHQGGGDHSDKALSGPLVWISREPGTTALKNTNHSPVFIGCFNAASQHFVTNSSRELPICCWCPLAFWRCLVGLHLSRWRHIPPPPLPPLPHHLHLLTVGTELLPPSLQARQVFWGRRQQMQWISWKWLFSTQAFLKCMKITPVLSKQALGLSAMTHPGDGLSWVLRFELN